MEEKQNNLNTIIGIGLIFLLLYLWMQYSAPPEQPKDATEAPKTEKQTAPAPAAGPAAPAAAPTQTDSAKLSAFAARYGAFAAAAQGTEQTVTLENDLMRVTFTSKGGRIKEVLLKKYKKVNTDSANNDKSFSAIFELDNSWSVCNLRTRLCRNFSI